MLPPSTELTLAHDAEALEHGKKNRLAIVGRFALSVAIGTSRGLLIGALGASAYSSVYYLGYTNDIFGHNLYLDTLESFNACADPTQAELDEVQRLITQPLPEDTMTAAYSAASVEDMESLLQEAADHLGVTIYPWRSETTALREDLETWDNSQLDGMAYLEQAQEFAARYNVDVRLATESDELYYGGTPLTADQINTYDFKYNIYYGVIAALGQIPVETVTATKLDEVVLAQLDPEIGGYVDATINKRVIVADPIDMATDILQHELGHVAHRQKCGGVNMDTDPGFAALNPGPLYGLPDCGQNNTAAHCTEALSLQDNSGHYLDLVLERMTTDDPTRGVELNNEIDALEQAIVVTEQYGKTNVVEDVATFYQYIFNPHHNMVVLNNRFDVINAKSRFLVARQLQDEPEATEYLVTAGKIMSLYGH